MSSLYARKLAERDCEDVFSRYCEKIKSIGVDLFLIDHFCNLKRQSINLDDFKNCDFPKIMTADIHEYFISKTSVFSYKEFRAYKSLSAYNYFVSGHIRNVKFLKIQENHVVRFQVSITNCNRIQN